MTKQVLISLLLCYSMLCCNSQSTDKVSTSTSNTVHSDSSENNAPFDTLTKTIHVFVALCDNTFQGIVPVPPGIGNGQDANSNLYWGCRFGVKTFFKNSKEWTLVKSQTMDSIRLERLVFKHKSKNYFLVADAYNGQFISQCTLDFLHSCCGQLKDTLHVNHTVIGIEGNAKLVVYIGHDGLMDFQLSDDFTNADNKERDMIILACISKKYFSPHVRKANVNPIIWSTGLMSPEAYTLHDALTGYVNNESNDDIKKRAAKAYASYQKCSLNAAIHLLATGW